MSGIHRYVNYINVLILICLIILVFSEDSFIRDTCIIRDDYAIFNNCAITTKELIFFCN